MTEQVVKSVILIERVSICYLFNEIIIDINMLRLFKLIPCVTCVVNINTNIHKYREEYHISYVMSYKIEITVHTSCYCVLDLLTWQY